MEKQCGIVMGGLLIDTLCYNHFVANAYYADKSYSDYYSVLIDLFEYLKGLNKDQSYWYALGSNQLVYNSDNGSFITKASNAYQKLADANDDEEKYLALNEILGKYFLSIFPNRHIASIQQRHTQIQSSSLKICFALTSGIIS